MKWLMPVILELGRLRQEDHAVKNMLDYVGRPCLKINLENPSHFSYDNGRAS